eukprot:SAG31_NODE_1509_length_8062_cov_6.974884_6_plen_220_part_00
MINCCRLPLLAAVQHSAGSGNTCKCVAKQTRAGIFLRCIVPPCQVIMYSEILELFVNHQRQGMGRDGWARARMPAEVYLTRWSGGAGLLSQTARGKQVNEPRVDEFGRRRRMAASHVCSGRQRFNCASVMGCFLPSLTMSRPVHTDQGAGKAKSKTYGQCTAHMRAKFSTGWPWSGALVRATLTPHPGPVPCPSPGARGQAQARQGAGPGASRRRCERR